MPKNQRGLRWCEMPYWEEIQREWETTKITFTALAEKQDVKLGTLKSRKSRDK